MLKDFLFLASCSSMALLASVPYTNLPAFPQSNPTSKRCDFGKTKSQRKKELLLYPKVRSFYRSTTTIEIPWLVKLHDLHVVVIIDLTCSLLLRGKGITTPDYNFPSLFPPHEPKEAPMLPLRKWHLRKVTRKEQAWRQFKTFWVRKRKKRFLGLPGCSSQQNGTEARVWIGEANTDGLAGEEVYNNDLDFAASTSASLSFSSLILFVYSCFFLASSSA